jgi:uncharacterized OB-fold protein
MSVVNELPRPFDSVVLEDHEGEVVLHSGVCQSCRHSHFPPQGCCPTCGGSVDVVALPRSGEVYSVTSTEWPLPGATSPVVIVLVAFGTDVIIQGVIDTRVSIGDNVDLTRRIIPGPDGDLLCFGFTKAATDA